MNNGKIKALIIVIIVTVSALAISFVACAVLFMSISNTSYSSYDGGSGNEVGDIWDKLADKGGNSDKNDSGEAGTDNEADQNDASSEDGEGDDKSEEEKLSMFEELFSDGPCLAYDENMKGGYINIQGDFVIAPSFALVRPFHEGLAAVKDPDTGLWGYIDLNGNYVIQPKFYRAFWFKDGYAVVKLQQMNGYGVIDKSGNYVIDPVYKFASYFKEGYALVQDPDSGYYHYVDENGNYAFGEEFYDAYLFHDGKAVVSGLGAYPGWHIMDKDFNFTPFSVDVERMYEVCAWGESVADSQYIRFDEPVVVETTDKLYVMVDGNGNAVSPFFDELSGFINDIAVAGQLIDGEIRYGYIDRDFNWVIEPQFQEAFSCNQGYMVVCKFTGNIAGDWFVIDKEGNDVLDCGGKGDLSLYKVEPDTTPLYPIPVRRTSSTDPAVSECGYVDVNYNIVIPLIYESVTEFARDGSYAEARFEGKAGMIDQSGNWLIEPKFGNFDPYREDESQSGGYLDLP